MNFNIKDTFNTELPADPITVLSRRQVNACFSYVTPTKTSSPELVHVSDETLKMIGLQKSDGLTEEFLNIFTGNKVVSNTTPYAMCYGGHQFGSWAGQLGDGRAINLFEVNQNNQQLALQLKGAGETPYSRTADGLAVLRSSIREYLCSEAMHHLGVPGTRALSLSLTGDKVMRDMLYDGNSAYEKGAVVCRVAPSFLRFGNFQILAARENIETLTELVNYTVKHFYPSITGDIKEKTISLFREVKDRTVEMIIHWQRVGFVHGVMNTDNMSILGLTIDYGPYGWLEGYDVAWTPNTTDLQHKRYRYGNQPNMGLWNLLQLANALYPLVDEAKPFEDILGEYQLDFDKKYLIMMKSKLGLQSQDESDEKLIKTLELNLELSETDMTIFFRNLNLISKTSVVGHSDTVKDLLGIDIAFYAPKSLDSKTIGIWKDWLNMYILRLEKETLSDQNRYIFMNGVNPKYVFRNYMAHLAIEDADKGDYKLIKDFYQLLKHPYSEQKENEKWFSKRPDWAREKAGCSMLSCSS
jgi:uncharacterized protein YdiU (UPF0061 family)